MQKHFAEARAEALSYILLGIVASLDCYALWSHWHIVTLSAEEARQLGVIVQGAPALLAVHIVPLMLWAVANGNLQLFGIIRKRWLIFSLTAAGISLIVCSASWLLFEGAYQWGAQDRIMAAILMVPVPVLGIGLLGYAVAARLDRAGSG